MANRLPAFISKGDVIVAYDDVYHAHSAASDSRLKHIAIIAGTPKWLEPALAEEYDQL